MAVQKKKSEKLMEEINHWRCTKVFHKKVLQGANFRLAPAANHAWYKPIFYWWHEMAACSYFGVDLGKKLDHFSLSRLTDGTSHSSCDLPYFTLLLPFTWTNYSKFNFFLPFAFLDRNF